jgi:hypothetical protein
MVRDATHADNCELGALVRLAPAAAVLAFMLHISVVSDFRWSNYSASVYSSAAVERGKRALHYSTHSSLDEASAAKCACCVSFHCALGCTCWCPGHKCPVIVDYACNMRVLQSFTLWITAAGAAVAVLWC